MLVYQRVIKYWLPQNPRSIQELVWWFSHEIISFGTDSPQLASLITPEAFVIPIVNIVTIDIPYSVSLFMIINYQIVLLLSY
jgi:hypothetical protein